MNFTIWRRVWTFLNQPLFVKPYSPEELTIAEKIDHLERCLAIDIPKHKNL